MADLAAWKLCIRIVGPLLASAGLLAIAVLVGSGSAQAQRAAPANQLPKASGVPDALAPHLAFLNKKLDHLIEDVLKDEDPSFSSLNRPINEITKAKQEMVDEFFTAEVYGVKFSEVFKRLDCVDSELNLGLGESWPGSRATNERIAGLFKKARKCKEKLEKALDEALDEPPPPPPCTSNLARSPGSASYPAANHIRVQATCSQPIRRIVVTSLSGDTFNGCAQTAGTAGSCNSSGSTLTSTWNGPANEAVELYGRVAANADGSYRVQIFGENDVLLHQYEATVPG